MNPKSVDAAFDLFVFQFLRWISHPRRQQGLADESKHWLNVCKANRRIGYRGWSYEWLTNSPSGLAVTHFTDFDFDPVDAIVGAKKTTTAANQVLQKCARISGTITKYKGPQHALIDLGCGLTVSITPLEAITKDDEGRRASCYISFSYDGVVGWNPILQK